MNYGFVIDNRSCIGCHACSTACKSEHQVPLGVHRTWVKYTEVGSYPDVRRTFQVTRCNHCENPPCVRICPTAAMHQRPDGIVDFDGDACIGCKGCLQACPYDAIHIDPDTRTAAKCNFCAHRTSTGLEPACVVVCPEHAILAGDLDDPTSEISRVLAKNAVTVRKPEQGTRPNLFYIDGHDAALHPTATDRTPASFMYADVLELHPGQEARLLSPAGAPPTTQGAPAQGPISQAAVRVGFNAQHTIPWHWPIPLYLVTKHVAGGVFALLGVLALTGGVTSGTVLGPGLVGLVLTAVTLALLVYDLDRPDRFFYLLVRPQWRSWIARAAWLLSAFTAIAGAWWLTELIAGETALRPVFAALSIPLGFGVSVYTAFLFAQAEGRDLWQSTHVPFQMALHGVALGAAPLGLTPVFLGAIASSLVLTLLADLTVPQASELARRAAIDMTAGHYRALYWIGGIGLGHVLPLLLGGLGTPGLVLAFLSACVGLFAYNLAFVMAPQDQPNS